MDPFLLLGILAVVIGFVGVIVLMKSRKKNVRQVQKPDQFVRLKDWRNNMTVGRSVGTWRVRWSGLSV